MGKIEVKIQTEERMEAITALSHAIKDTAKALSTTPVINVVGCQIHGAETGIKIDTVEDVTETLIHKVED